MSDTSFTDTEEFQTIDKIVIVYLHNKGKIVKSQSGRYPKTTRVWDNKEEGKRRKTQVREDFPLGEDCLPYLRDNYSPEILGKYQSTVDENRVYLEGLGVQDYESPLKIKTIDVVLGKIDSLDEEDANTESNQ